MVTQLDVAREALAQIGTRSNIISLSDGSAEATYINLLYGPIRDFLLVDGDYDWSMVSLVSPVDQPGVPQPWLFSYECPTDALRIRQLIPGAFDRLDPHPIEWNVIYHQGGTRSILTSFAVGEMLYTASAIPEAVWDPMFRQSFVRMLASALAFALENRIEASKVKLDEALGFAGITKLRDI